ncbi:MAG: hypothetical protein ABJA67_04850 [Chthonomonadales bacterium]
MEFQQIIALLIVGVCATFLGRQSYAAVKRWRNASSNCGACGKCGFAPPEPKNVIPTSSVISRNALLVQTRPPARKD